MKMPNLASRYQAGTVYPLSDSQDAWNGPWAIPSSTDLRAVATFWSYVWAEALKVSAMSAEKKVRRVMSLRYSRLGVSWRMVSARTQSDFCSPPTNWS